MIAFLEKVALGNYDPKNQMTTHKILIGDQPKKKKSVKGGASETLNFLEDVGLGLFEKKGKKRSEGKFFHVSL